LQRTITNKDLRRHMAILHRQAHRSWLEEDEVLTGNLFSQMQEAARAESARLGHLTDQRRFLYEKEIDRMSCLHDLANEQALEPVQDDLPPHLRPEDNEGYIDYIRHQAEWLKPEFMRTIKRIVKRINSANTADDIVKSRILPLGSQAASLLLALRPDIHKMMPESRCSDIGTHCGVVFTDVKDRNRGLAKALQDYSDKAQRPAARYVCDWLRCTILAQDPFVLSLVYEALKKAMVLVRMKNNITNEQLPALMRTNLLANFKMCLQGAPHIVEVQLILQDFFTIRTEEHLFYELSRATRVEEILGHPIFDRGEEDNADPEDTSIPQVANAQRIAGKWRRTTMRYRLGTSEGIELAEIQGA